MWHTQCSVRVVLQLFSVSILVYGGGGQSGVPMYTVKYRNSYCLLASFNLSVDISYPKLDGTVGLEKFHLNLTNNQNESTCSEGEANLNLLALPRSNIVPWSIRFNFTRKLVDTLEYYSLDFIEFTYISDPHLFPNIAVQGAQYLNTSASLFTSQLGNCYECKSERSIQLQHMNKGQSTATLHMSFAKIEAFSNSSKPAFSDKVYTCSADLAENNIVPIVVGVTLAVLIVTALIVFLIFNRRSRRYYEAA